jgi:hypothetical protein
MIQFAYSNKIKLNKYFKIFLIKGEYMLKEVVN